GIPAASALSVDSFGTGLPCGSRNMSRVAAPGAFSRASIIVSKPSLARWIRMKPPAPSPDAFGSTTLSAAATATAASNALPPASSISLPAAVASGCAVAIPACAGRRSSAAALCTTKMKTRKTLSRARAAAPAGRKWVMGELTTLLLLQFRSDDRMHEFSRLAAQHGDLPDEGGGDESELFLRREKHGFDVAIEVTRHVRELE